MENQEIQSQDKTNKFDGIEDALDVESDIIPVKKPKVEIESTASTKEQLKKDYEYTRGHLYSLVEKGQEAVDGILELAQESDQPRAFEVAGQLIKTVGETAEKLIDLQSKMKKLEQDDVKIRDQHNHLYVGSTSELQKFLKKNNGTSEE